MYIGMTIILCSICNIFIVAYNFYSKKRIVSLETKIYSFMIIISILSLLFEFLSIIFVSNYQDFYIQSQIVNRIFILCILGWTSLLTAYIYSISFIKDSNNNIDTKQFPKRTLIAFSGIILLFTFLIITLPLNFYSENNIVYSYGEAADINSVIVGTYIVVWLYCIFKNFKYLKNKKYLPILIFIICIIITLVVRTINPGILLINATISLVTVLMYNTIENPDLKVLNEVTMAKDQAEKANRAKSDFLSSMSHEIRTPLNAIVGLAELLKESKNLNKEERLYLNDMKYASDTLLDIIENILDMNKIESGNLSINSSNYDSNEMFTKVANLFNCKIKEKGLVYKVSIAPDIPKELYGDKVNIRKIITNLLSNAIKYTNEGSIEYDVKSVINGNVCRLFITVADTGRGIKKENIDKMFQKFERLDEKNTTIEGTGLGLAITKAYLDAMGGKITVNSEVGVGSRFVVTIDQKIVNSTPTGVVTNYTNDVADATKKVVKKYEVDMSNKRVLIVDDNNLNLKVESNLLKKNFNIVDENIVAVLTGQECIDRIKADEKYDLILMDDMMPEMNGQETFAKLKLLNGFNIPTVMLTANAIDGAKEMYLEQGFAYYLSKPLKLEDMNKALKYIFSNNSNQNLENTVKLPALPKEIYEINDVVDSNESL